ncbi:MAG: COG1361 S-layer family protein [Candidatus Diapherotrites archaeon]|nr:COG1361 S-layer family protein [Candidatus Diapherotrites archaeon]
MKKILIILTIMLFSLSVVGASFDLDSYNYTPSPVSAGDNFDLILQVKNTSNTDAEKVNVSLEIEWPFIYSPENEKTIESIKGNRIAIVEFKGLKVDSKAKTGTYTLTVKYSEEGNDIQRKSTATISVNAAKPKIELIKSSENEIQLGETKQVEYTFKNIGGDTAKDIVVEFQEDRTVTTTGTIVEREIIPVGSASSYIKELAPGEETILSFTLSANNNAEIKNYTLPLKIEFTDSKSTEYETTAYAGMKIKAEPELDALISSIGTLYPGAESEIVFDIFNIGKASALYTVMELKTNSLEFEKTKTFIGTLEADDFDSFKTTVKVPANLEPGKHIITTEFTFKDSGTMQKTIMKELEVNIVPAGSIAGSTDMIGMILGLLGTVLALIGLVWVGKTVYSKLKK